MRQTNNRTTLNTGHGPSRSLRLVRCEDMAAAERLPNGLRRMLWETPVKLSAVTVLAFLHSIQRQVGDAWEAERITARKLLQIEETELEGFAQQERSQYGYALPHCAAEARCVRYGKLGEVQGKRRRGMRLRLNEGDTF